MKFFKTCSAFVVLFSVVFFMGCSTTITKTKKPVFSADTKTLQQDLNALVSCENIDLNGQEVSTNGKQNSELKISITNGKNLPADNAKLKALGKSIALDIKKSLKDTNEYEKYVVVFVSLTKDGSVTKKSWKGNEFKSVEL